jgi:hypothetical protein
MPMPPPEHFSAVADDLDIDLTPSRLAQAYETHAKFRRDLERLRDLQLSFLEPVSEPAAGFVWIANGGVS